MGRLNDIRQAARQAFTAGNLSYSIELYEQLTDLTKDNPLIDDVINYGAILRKTKQLRKASSHYIEYLPLFANNIHFIQNACNCWIELNDFEKSRVVLKQALDRNKNNPELLLTLGFTELSAGKSQKACKLFESILQIDPNYFDAWFNLGVAKSKAGLLEEALICFRQAHQQKNDHVLLKANIIILLQDLNRIDDAWKEIEELMPTTRSSPEIKFVEACLLMSEEKYTEASILLRDLCQKHPQSSKYWLNWVHA